MESHISIPIFIFVFSLFLLAIVFVARKTIDKFLSNFSVKSKLSIIALLSVFSLLSIVIIESFFMNKLNKEIKAIAERDLPLIEKMTKAEFNVMEGNIFFEKAINMRLLEEPRKSTQYFSESDSNFVTAEQYIEKIIVSIKKYLSISISEGETQEFTYLINELEKINTDTLKNHKEKIEFFGQYEQYSRTQLIENIERIGANAIAIERGLEEILINFEEFTEKSALKAEKLEKFALNTSLAIGFLLLSTLLALISKIAIGISNPISREAERIQSIARPSLERSQSCLRLSSDLDHSSSQQVNAITQTAASCEEISQTLEVNLRLAENSKVVAGKAQESVDTTLTAMDSLLQSIEALKKSNDNMNEFVDIVETIRAKTAIIDEIVFQTKLLSFNASLEAERAGEHGRGFAVVASEVGQLASNSGKASIEISGLIKESNVKVKDTISINRKNMVSAITNLDVVLKEGKTLKKDIDALSESNDSIAVASREQTEGVRQVNEAILEIQKHSDKTSKYAQELSSISKEIVSTSDQLDICSKVLSGITFGKSESNHPSTIDLRKSGENLVRVDFQSESRPLEKVAVGQDFNKKGSTGGWEKV
ncbi:MAG: methyl-accepting chemotaxis protein [Oligoflexales bacterium]